MVLVGTLRRSYMVRGGCERCGETDAGLTPPPDEYADQYLEVCPDCADELNAKLARMQP